MALSRCSPLISSDVLKMFFILQVKISCKVAPENASESWIKQSSYSSRFWFKNMCWPSSLFQALFDTGFKSMSLGLRIPDFKSWFCLSRAAIFYTVLGKGWWYSWYWRRWMRILLTLLKNVCCNVVFCVLLVVLLNVHEKYRVFSLGNTSSAPWEKCHWPLKTT